MFAPKTTIRTFTAAAAGILALTLLPAATPADAREEPGPIHAGNTFGWYHGGNVTRFEFHGSRDGFWKVSGHGNVRNQHGMLTLNTGQHGNTTAVLGLGGHQTGRWEIRLRSRRYETKHTDYKVVTELVPAGKRPQYCGHKDIGIENYTLGTHRAKFYLHSLPDNSYRAFKGMSLQNDQWHTFAIEVTKHRISFFVDAKVFRTERRDKALTGATYTVKFEMRAQPGKRMNKSRMQMDWLRYWRADSPNTKSTAAPRLTAAHYPGNC